LEEGARGRGPLPLPPNPHPQPHIFIKVAQASRLCGYEMMNQARQTDRIARIHAVSVSDRKGVVKHNVPCARLLVEHGLEGDAHAEGGIRQVSLLSLQSINKMIAMGAAVKPGDFAENLTVDGLEVMTLAVGTRLKVGHDVLLEITQIGKTCHKGCAIRELVGDCVMPREGVFARVLAEGEVKVGDTIEVLGFPG
jgi:MOSC domain-containing protein YiiM